MALTYGSTWPVDRKYVGHSTLSFYGTWPHTTSSHNSYTATVLDSRSVELSTGLLKFQSARSAFRIIAKPPVAYDFCGQVSQF